MPFSARRHLPSDEYSIGTLSDLIRSKQKTVSCSFSFQLCDYLIADVALDSLIEIRIREQLMIKDCILDHLDLISGQSLTDKVEVKCFLLILIHEGDHFDNLFFHTLFLSARRAGSSAL